jgi:hypothetical protein
VDRTGSGSCPVTACGSSGIEPSDSKMDLMEVICENGRWIELAQGRVQWQAVVLALLSHRVLLSDSKLDLR